MQEQTSGKLNIIVAIYGLKLVTNNISNLIIEGNPETLNFKINNRTIGEDGWRGQRKSVTIVYNYDGGEPRTAAAKEGDTITITPDNLKQIRPAGANTSAKENVLSVLAATYGPDDVTYKVKNLISSNNTLSFTTNNTLFGDAWYGVPKTLVIVLGQGNTVKAVEVFTEREYCYVDLNDAIPAL